MANVVKRKLAEWLLKDMNPGGGFFSGSAASGSGVPVNSESSMRYAAVQACIRVLSEDISSLPLHVFRRLEDGGKERATDHPLYNLLHSRPNPEMTSVAFREALMVNLLLYGNGYAFIEYDRAGRVMALWPISSESVEPFRDRDRVIRYRVSGRTIDAAEILHIPGMGFDGLVGMSPIAYAREAIGLGIAAEQFGSKFFKNGTHLGGVVTVPGKLSDSEFERVSKEFKAMYKGLQNSHGVPLLEGGAEFKPFGIAPDDAQFLQTRKYQRTEIAAIFRVPLHMIGDLEHATFSNIEHQDISYLQRSLLPWLVRIEQGMSNKLLSDEERSVYLIEHDTGGFMRGDTKSRYEAYAIGITNGILTRNEARVRENLNPIDGADELIMPLNMTTVGAADPGEDNGKRAEDGEGKRFMLADVSDFTSDRRRRAVMGKRNAAQALGLKNEQLKALEKAFSKWLDKQAKELIQMLEGETGKRGRKPKPRISMSDFIAKVDSFFDGLLETDMPKDIRMSMRDSINTTVEKLKKELGDEAAALDEKWLKGFMDRYNAEARDRLVNANREAVKRMANSEMTEGEIEQFMKKLRGWGTDRARNMAKYEAALAVNEALVAGYRSSGYESVWQSAPGCCKICTNLNGKTVSTLKPPLHKGCVCSVAKGKKRKLTDEELSDKIKQP